MASDKFTVCSGLFVQLLTENVVGVQFKMRNKGSSNEKCTHQFQDQTCDNRTESDSWDQWLQVQGFPCGPVRRTDLELLPLACSSLKVKKKKSLYYFMWNIMS